MTPEKPSARALEMAENILLPWVVPDEKRKLVYAVALALDSAIADATRAERERCVNLQRVLWDLVQDHLDWARLKLYCPAVASRVDDLLADFVRYPDEASIQKPADG